MAKKLRQQTVISPKAKARAKQRPSRTALGNSHSEIIALLVEAALILIPAGYSAKRSARITHRDPRSIKRLVQRKGQTRHGPIESDHQRDTDDGMQAGERHDGTLNERRGDATNVDERRDETIDDRRGGDAEAAQDTETDYPRGENTVAYDWEEENEHLSVVPGIPLPTSPPPQESSPTQISSCFANNSPSTQQDPHHEPEQP